MESIALLWLADVQSENVDLLGLGPGLNEACLSSALHCILLAARLSIIDVI